MFFEYRYLLPEWTPLIEKVTTTTTTLISDDSGESEAKRPKIAL